MKLRVGIAGYGLAGRSFHAPILSATNFDIAAILTNNDVRKRHAKEDFPAAKILSNIEELCEQGLDLVVIASGNQVHLSQALAAIKAGIPTVVDKPMGINVAQTEEILNASMSAGVPVTTYFNRKWDSDTLTLKRVIRDGHIGRVIRMDSRFERFRPQLNPQSWRENNSPQDGGGLLLDLAPHLISTAIDCFGHAELKSASIRSVRGGADDDCVLLLGHDSGVESILSASAVVGSPGPRLRVIGSDGAFVVNELDPQEALLRSGKKPKDGKWNEDTASKAFIHRGDSVEEFKSDPGNYSHFYSLVHSAIVNKTAMPIGSEEILAVARIIDHARKINTHG
ncbi:MAG: dehydrogenase [Actinobacteria bacterium]|nr:dehydrogenase [Actinomycetota bacterium]